MKIGIGRIWQETNTFSAKNTTVDDFQRNGLYFGKEVLVHLDQLPELSGAASVANSYASDIELVPLMAAMAWPAGRLTAKTHEFLKAGFINCLNQEGNLDGLFISLHGALAAEGCDDVEGELLSLVRGRLGDKLPMCISLDMHANISRSMMKSRAIFVGYHTCPHLDVEQTGGRAMQVLIDMIAAKIKPTPAWCKIPMVVPADKHNHFEGPFRELAAEVERIEKSPQVISASIFAVQPWLDVEELGWTTVVITEGHLQLAQELADKLGEECWQRRAQFGVDKMPPGEAVKRALKIKGNPVVISDSSDSTNSGAPGNSTWLLKEILDAGVREPVFLTMVAPAAAQKAYQAGVGAWIEVEFGSVPTNPFTQSFKIRVRVELLHNGKIYLSGHGGKNLVMEMGKTAVLAAGNIKIVTSEAVGPGHVPPEFFRQLGLEVREAKIIVAKSPVGFRASYEPIAAEIILCEAPGPASSDLLSLDYQKIPKPLYPFEPDMKWSISQEQEVSR